MKFKTLRNLMNYFHTSELVVRNLTNEKMLKKLISDFRYDLWGQLHELRNAEHHQRFYDRNFAEETKELIRDLLDDKNELVKLYNEKFKEGK